MGKTYLAGVDAGNGFVNVALGKGKTSHGVTRFTSVRKEVTGATLGLDEFEQDVPYVNWAGRLHVFGDDVRLVRGQAERHQGGNRYGDEFWQSLVAVGLVRAGVKGGTVNMITTVPPKYYRTAKDAIERQLTGAGRTVAVHVKGEKKPRVWEYGAVKVLPEGLAAACTLFVNNKGEIYNADFMRGTWLILDPGLYTLESMLFVNGNLNADELPHATHTEAGVRHNILEPLLREVHDMGAGYRRVTVDDLDYALRNGRKLQLANGTEIDLTEAFQTRSRLFAEFIANSIIDTNYDLNELRGMVVFGGIADDLVPHFANWYHEGRVYKRSDQAVTRSVQPGDANAVGALWVARWMNMG